MREPFVGLRPFTAEDKDLFFGRSREIEVVKNLVATLPIVIMYATSGTGKSSLLRAGLLPALQDAGARSAPVFIADPAEDLVSAVRRTLGLAGNDSSTAATLHAALAEHHAKSSDRAVIIVDQFEERLKRERELENLWAELAVLANSREDLGCVVLSLREDYLGGLTSLLRRIPGVLDGGFRLSNLSEDDLHDAVFGPLRAVGSEVQVDESIVETVLADLRHESRSPDLRTERIEAGYFQIVWSYLWSHPSTQESGVISGDVYEGAGRAQGIISTSVERTLARLLPYETEVLSASLRYLVLPTGAKVPLTVDDLVGLVQPFDFTGLGLATVGSQPHRVSSVLDRLFDKLTRSDAPMFRRVTRGGRVEFELVHDLLGLILLDWKTGYGIERSQVFEDATSAVAQEILSLVSAQSLSMHSFSGPDPVKRLDREVERILANTSPQPSPVDVQATVQRWESVLAKAWTAEETLSWRGRSATREIVGRVANNVSQLRETSVRQGIDPPEEETAAAQQVASETVVALLAIISDEGRVRGKITQLALDQTRLRRQLRMAENSLISILGPPVGFVVAWIVGVALLDPPFVHYAWLTLGAISVCNSLLYALAGSDIGTVTTLRSRARRILFPRYEAPPYASRLRRAQVAGVVSVVTWWLLAHFLVISVGMLGALFFNSLDWSPTAGFIIGAILSSISLGGSYVAISEL